ncbi:hypothetical protein MFIFM68171_08070 [Madurella fahalii]|uniref:Uncharacterized protein n=1 Tax=Madurella fahalii TaxID=1157608 RepID=A0ABQ0GJH3_9PEZI
MASRMTHLDERQTATALIALKHRPHLVVDASTVEVIPPWGIRGDEINPQSPPSPPYSCAENCKTCSRQYFPVARRLSNEAAKDVVESLVRGISENHTALQQALSSHADAIAIRWRKRSRERRRTLLESLSSLHPDKHGIRALVPARDNTKELETTRKTAGGYLDTWLTPWLDISTLSESPLNFLALLKHRTSCHPAQWVMFDYQQADLALTYGVLGRYYNRHAIRLTDDEFGQLVEWDKARVHSHEDFGLNAGLYILTAGHRISQILLGVVNDLLAEIRQRAEKHAKTHTVGQSNPNVGQALSTWTNLVNNNFTSFGGGNTGIVSPPKSTFTDPMPLTLAQLRDMILTRDKAASDELKLVQSDAEYVHHLVSEVEKTFARDVLDDEGVWAFLSQTVLVQPLLNKLWWDEVLSRAQRAADCYAAIISAGGGGGGVGRSEQHKREELDVLLVFMKEACTQQLVTQLVQLYGSLSHEPGLDPSLLNLEYHVDFRTTDPLFWVLTTMGYDEGRDATLPLSISLDFLQTYLAANEKAKSRVSSRLLKRITDISSLNDILTALDRYRGHNSCVLDDHSPANPGLIENERLKIEEFQKAWKAVDTDRLSRKAAMLLKKIFATVEDATVDSMSNEPDAKHKSQCAALIAETKATVQPRAPAGGSSSFQGQLRDPLPAIDLERGVKSLSLWDEMMMSQTSPTNEPSTTSDALEPAHTVGKEEADDARGFQSSGGASKAEMAQAKQRWPKFVAAMEDAGFIPTEGAGSAVTFHATDGSGSITFHKPHPDSTIFPVMLRTFGRRMATWFDWKPSNFSPI